MNLCCAYVYIRRRKFNQVYTYSYKLKYFLHAEI